MKQDNSPERPRPQLLGPPVRGRITCTRTRRCAVWCFLTGSVSGSCTCRGRPSCSLRGSCRSPSSWSRPERWRAPSLKPAHTHSQQHVAEIQIKRFISLFMAVHDGTNCVLHHFSKWFCNSVSKTVADCSEELERSLKCGN